MAVLFITMDMLKVISNATANTYRFRPQTAQLQLCFCCSFIFLSTASFSTLTRSLRSCSPRLSQNSLIRSRSSSEFVLQILFAFLGLLLLPDPALPTGARCFPEAVEFDDGGVP